MTDTEVKLSNIDEAMLVQYGVATLELDELVAELQAECDMQNI
ncbi:MULTISPECIES: hypothetical protein [Helicobacter]|nr:MULTISPECIES: hypothetical protein [Helicobacter]